jgi:hypothetical protein
VRGVGAAADPYEQHADAVADRVVQGKSAEDLLGQMAGPAGANVGAVQQRAVQRSEGPPPGPAPVADAGGEQRPEAEETPAPDPQAEANARKAELAGVVNPPIEQGPRDAPATLDPETKNVENMVSDSPDSILLKNRLISLTAEYLELKDPEPAIKQSKLDTIKQTFEELRQAMRHARGVFLPLLTGPTSSGPGAGPELQGVDGDVDRPGPCGSERDWEILARGPSGAA